MATVTWPATVCITTEEGTECDNRTVYHYLSGSSLETPPAEPCFECGSLINVDERSIIETIPLAGTDIKIVYSSAMTPQFISPYNTLGFRNLFNPHGLTVSIQHFLDYPQLRLYRGSGEVEDAKATAGPGDHFVVSKSGDEVYVFESSGRHKETRYGLTGATKYTFNYTVGNRLSSIVDAFGNTTTFTRDGSGNLTQIVAPFGQVNLITLNSGGLIYKVENPAGEIYELTYKSGTKLVETLKRPGAQTSTYTYDSNGRLIKDEGHGGNFWSLSQNTGLPGQPITLSSKLGRQKVLQTFKSSTQPYQRVETHPNGNVVTYSEDFTSGQTVRSDLVQSLTTQTATDSRFSNTFKRTSSETFGTGGNNRTTLYGISTTWPSGVGHGFWNFLTITETKSTSSRTETSVYTAATKTKVVTSDEGATATTVIDDFERPVSFQVGADTAWTLSYDTNGRLTELVQGANKKQTIAYNSLGYVDYIKNVRNEQTSYTYDLAGRPVQMILPDSRVVGFSYDANGNLTGVTPPGRPQHVFQLNGFELMNEYQPPAIGIGVSKNTSYTYNDDKQLTGVTRTDGASVS